MFRIIHTISLILVIVAFKAQVINTKLNYIVTKPSKVTNKTPVLIILHGYGSRESDSKQLMKTLQDKFLVFSLRAPRTTTVGGFCWFDMQFLEWAQFKCDYKQVEESRNQILSFISNACKAYNADSTQVYVLGFSQGGMMAYDIGLNAPTKIKGVVALSTRLMEETMLRPGIDWTNAQKVKYLIIGGYSDNVISYLDSYKSHDFLKTKGVWDVYVKFYDIKHTIVTQEIGDIKYWLGTKVGV